MTDTSYATKVRMTNGGDILEVAPGGAINLGDDIALTVNAAGQAVFTGLPTADPSVIGALYSNGGILTISAG